MSFRMFAWLFALSASAQEAWTEAAVVRRFMEQNPLARETRARVAIGEAETLGRTLYANPTLSVSREGAGRTEFYQASQALPLSGRFPLLRSAGTQQSKALASEGEFSLWQARCSLRSAFYRMLASQERLSALDASAAELTEAIRVLRERELAGEGSKLDRMRAERESFELSAERTGFDAALAFDRGELLAFLPALTALEQVTGGLSIPPMTGVLRSVVERPDIAAERARMAQYGAEQQAAARLRIPEPVVTAGFKRADLGLPQLAAGPVVGVSVALPVFQKGKAETARYAAEQERAAARVDQLTRRAQATVEASGRVLAIRHEASVRYAGEAGTSDELVRMATVAYQEGEIGVLALLDAYRVRRQARLRAIDLASAAKQAQIAVEAALGEELPR